MALEGSLTAAILAQEMPAEVYSQDCPIPRSVLRPDLRESSPWNL
jgi:hypothetical protein